MKVNEYVRAASLEEAYSLKKLSPKNKILGGGLWLKKGNGEVDKLIDLSRLGLDQIKEEKDYVSVGAMVTQRAFETSPIIKKIGGGVLSDAVHQIMGPAFRNSATIGGSVYGKYGFSDVITALLGFKVDLVFYPEEVVSLDAYVKKPGFADGILTEIRIYKSSAKSFFKKVKITALDYPILNVCVTKDKDYRIVVGSRPLVAYLCEGAMKYLNDGGKDIDQAVEIAMQELKLGDSMSAKGEYRSHLARVYLKRALEEVK